MNTQINYDKSVGSYTFPNTVNTYNYNYNYNPNDKQAYDLIKSFTSSFNIPLNINLIEEQHESSIINSSRSLDQNPKSERISLIARKSTISISISNSVTKTQSHPEECLTQLDKPLLKTSGSLKNCGSVKITKGEYNNDENKLRKSYSSGSNCNIYNAHKKYVKNSKDNQLPLADKPEKRPYGEYDLDINKEEENNNNNKQKQYEDNLLDETDTSMYLKLNIKPLKNREGNTKLRTDINPLKSNEKCFNSETNSSPPHTSTHYTSIQKFSRKHLIHSNSLSLITHNDLINNNSKEMNEGLERIQQRKINRDIETMRKLNNMQNRSFYHQNSAFEVIKNTKKLEAIQEYKRHLMKSMDLNRESNETIDLNNEENWASRLSTTKKQAEKKETVIYKKRASVRQLSTKGNEVMERNSSLNSRKLGKESTSNRNNLNMKENISPRGEKPQDDSHENQGAGSLENHAADTLENPRSHNHMNHGADSHQNHGTDRLENSGADNLENPRTDSLENSEANNLANSGSNNIANPHADSLGYPEANSLENSRTITLANSETNSLSNPPTNSFESPIANNPPNHNADGLMNPHTNSFESPRANNLPNHNADSLENYHTDIFKNPRANNFSNPHTDNLEHLQQINHSKLSTKLDNSHKTNNLGFYSRTLDPHEEKNIESLEIKPTENSKGTTCNHNIVLVECPSKEKYSHIAVPNENNNLGSAIYSMNFEDLKDFSIRTKQDNSILNETSHLIGNYFIVVDELQDKTKLEPEMIPTSSQPNDIMIIDENTNKLNNHPDNQPNQPLTTEFEVNKPIRNTLIHDEAGDSEDNEDGEDDDNSNNPKTLDPDSTMSNPLCIESSNISNSKSEVTLISLSKTSKHRVNDAKQSKNSQKDHLTQDLDTILNKNKHNKPKNRENCLCTLV